ncbi:MAG TPA: LysE family transporter [Geminicoccaceae bacterium]|nr:LysE family transporter [Geminicoccaceae bacterium]
MEGLLAFVVVGSALTGSPGPATLSLAATGAAFGARRGLRYMAGIVAGVVVVMVITASGVTGLMLALPGAAPVLAAMAAAYVIYLAWRIATAPPPHHADQGKPPSLGGGFFLALANPKAYAAMAALFSGFVLVPERPAWDALLKALVLLAIMIVVDLAWLLVGAALTRAVRRPGVSRAINLTFAALLVASVAFAFLL